MLTLVLDLTVAITQYKDNAPSIHQVRISWRFYTKLQCIVSYSLQLCIRRIEMVYI